MRRARRARRGSGGSGARSGSGGRGTRSARGGRPRLKQVGGKRLPARSSSARDAKRDAERVRRLDVARRADARRDARAHRAVLVVLPRDVARGGDAVERRASAARVRGVRGTDAGVRAVRDVSSDGEKRRRMGRRRVPGVRERGDGK